MKIGMYGSPAHILGNKSIEDKKGCLKTVTKEGVKDAFKLYGSIGAVAGAGAAAVKLSPKAASGFSKVISLTKEGAKKVFNPEMLNKVKNSGVYKKLAGLPTWGKAAIAIGAAAASVITPLFLTHSAQKSARIEKSYES